MTELRFEAMAKINLTLDVIGKRPDGYHELKTVMATVGLADSITLRLLDRPVFEAHNNLPYLPNDRRNLALSAAKLYLDRTGRGMGAEITLHKRIPVAAGLGGGSADAAAVLNALNRHFGDRVDFATLSKWALELGSDVPYCLRGGVALAEGRGELLTGLPNVPACHVILCRPSVAVSTRDTFKALSSARLKTRPDLGGMLEALRLGDLEGIARRAYNVFEAPMTAKIKEIGEIRSALIDGGALGACMSGSGATVFGIFRDRAAAERTCGALSAVYADTFLAEMHRSG